METHKNLRVWQQSIEMVTSIYFVTKTYPKDELFGLVSQMRRASVSVPSNIAEGYARGSEKEKLHFLRLSSGSISELETQLILSFQLGYINKDTCDELSEKITSLWKQLNALISSVKNNLTLQDSLPS